MSYVSFPLLALLPRILLINMLIFFQVAFRIIYEYLLMVPHDYYHLILIYIRRYWLIQLWLDSSVFCLSFPITTFPALEKSEYYFLIFVFLASLPFQFTNSLDTSCSFAIVLENVLSMRNAFLLSHWLKWIKYFKVMSSFIALFLFCVFELGFCYAPQDGPEH